MKYILNKQRGSTINHPALPGGKLEGATAIQVEDHVANQLKGIYNVVIFDDVKKTGGD